MLFKIISKLFPKMYMSWGDESETSSSSETKNDWRMAPEYSEAVGARQNWWDTLQKWQTQPGYGAIQPDWNSIWENARGKVQRYFGGGPEGPGINATVKSSLARRGMSESPAAETLLQRSGFQQGNMLQDLAVQQATKEAELSESGRTTWLNSLMQLAGLKPQMLNYGTETTGSSTTTTTPGVLTSAQKISDIFSDLTTGGYGGVGSSDLDKIAQMYGTGGYDTGIGDITDSDLDTMSQDQLDALLFKLRNG